MFVDDLIKVADTWTGIKENTTLHLGILGIYNTQTPLPRGYKVKSTDSWCMTGLCALFIACNIENLIPMECSCQNHIELSKEWEIFHEDRDFKVGDIIYYSWKCNGHADHVGLVVSVPTQSTLKVWECNFDNAVRYRTINKTSKYIVGYTRPRYKTRTQKSITEIAKDCIKGIYGNGEMRKRNLQKLGVDYDLVRNEINRLYRLEHEKTLDITSVALSVIQGKYGNGEMRKRKLAELGFDYDEVQAKVNELLNT